MLHDTKTFYTIVSFKLWGKNLQGGLHMGVMVKVSTYFCVYDVLKILNIKRNELT